MDWQVIEMVSCVVFTPDFPHHATLMVMSPGTTPIYLDHSMIRELRHCRPGTTNIADMAVVPLCRLSTRRTASLCAYGHGVW